MKFLKRVYLLPRMFILLAATVILIVFGNFWKIFVPVGNICLFVIAFLLLLELLLIFKMQNGISASRHTPEKFSNGDDNPIKIHIENRYNFQITTKIIDELPFQLQIRDFSKQVVLPSQKSQTLTYTIRPLTRGEYHFGALNIYVSSIIGLISKRYIFAQDVIVPVYPSYIQMRNYELFAVSNRLAEIGIKKNRRMGHTFEFDHIRKYIVGDDYRTINWKATARKANLMVNQYQDEKSQQVYSVIDMGRVMKMPFKGMSLLDYAINASLVISNIAIRRYDKAGIITFSNKIGNILAADSKMTQMVKILELLFNQQTTFPESNYELLFATIAHRVKQRSLIILYSNFETLWALRRQLPYILKLANHHLLVIIFFENTELRKLLDKKPITTEEIYIKTIAEKFAYEKRQIIKELDRYGVHSILTPPSQLTVNTINKYLELKARGSI